MFIGLTLSQIWSFYQKVKNRLANSLAPLWTYGASDCDCDLWGHMMSSVTWPLDSR